MPDPVIGCSSLAHLVPSTGCIEQFSGVESTIYVFRKSDLTSEPILDTATGAYSALVFKEGAGAYKLVCKDDSNKVDSKSSKFKNGFEVTMTAVVDRFDAEASLDTRAINNEEVGFIVPDDTKNILVYNPNRRLQITTAGTTGAKADDERTTTITAVMSKSRFQYPTVPGPITLYTPPVIP